MDKRIIELEDEEITRLYNKAYGDPEKIAKDRELAEEMLGNVLSMKRWINGNLQHLGFGTRLCSYLMEHSYYFHKN